jgi:hypothetical protein
MEFGCARLDIFCVSHRWYYPVEQMKKENRTIKALQLIEKEKPKSFRRFAQLFWPDSEMHTNSSNCGYGARRGAGAFLCAGSFLSKLEKQGFIVKQRYPRSASYPIVELTDKGRELIQKANP